MAVNDGLDQRRGIRNRRLLSLGGGLVTATLLIAIPVVVFRDPPQEGFRLRAQTMIPEAIYLPSDEPCPTEPATSPFDFQSDGALVDQLRVYEGELIAVRVTVAPYLGPAPEQVDFTARWPDSVVDEDSPSCAYVISDVEPSNEDERPVLEWSRTGTASADFSVRNVRNWSPTVIEMWLRARAPLPGAALHTDLGTPSTGDRVVVEPLGGRIALDRRPGVAADVNLVAASDDIVEDAVEAIAVVSNSTERERAFDVQLTVDSPSGRLSWSVPDVPDGVDCASGEQLSCQLGLIGPGEVIEIPFSAVVNQTIDQSVQSCGAEARTSGVCVVASVSSATGNRPTTVSSPKFFALRPQSTGGFVITTDPPTISRRPNEPTEIRLLVRAAADDDLAGIEVVGSDCVELTRATSAEDDGDAFLEPGETWSFDCTIGADSPPEFRVDIAGTNASGDRVIGSFRALVQTVDPDLAVIVSEPDEVGRTLVTITNIGQGAIYGLAVFLPGCALQEVEDLVLPRLGQGEATTVVCSQGAIDESGVIAYGTDVSGRPYVSSLNGDQG
ncbi:MAG TPA: hypothetical protein VMM60_06945 [Ilumatobacter sp.]|nr:hypothetical protein [Ilumatobacter sp.]